MSKIKTGTTLTTAYQVEGDTTGALVIQTGSTPTTAMTISAAQVVTFANPPTGVFPSGTKMMFVQTAAPTGWTKDTTHDNKALRVVSGTASSGGSVAFTTAFASQAVSGTVGSTTATNQATTAGGTVGATTLALSQIPSHRHPIRQEYGTNGNPSYPPGSNYSQITSSAAYGYNDSGPSSENQGGGGSHNHSFSGTSHNHTQDAHNHSFSGTAINMAVQYVDVIIATKD